MKVTVNNETIKTFISYHGYTKEQFAKLCHIKRKQVDTLLTKKTTYMAISTMLDIIGGMGLSPIKIFPMIETATEGERLFFEIGRNALNQNNDTKKDMN